tara:strand:+ start:347 stop:565 length:219 start_codon:yes stop_codon:yes gene_type:complete
MINGVTCPNPKKNRNKIDIRGFFAWETQASKVAKTGVIQGDDASPNVVPVIRGARNGGSFFSRKFKDGALGS